ncbi:sugar phosphate isomerase/epimerase family protein [Actinobaculum suis]|nr:TIM barrel protein [Actinobaculum suis]
MERIMAGVGISTYALFWEISDRVPNPLDLSGMVARTRELDCEVLQICDYPKLEALSSAELTRLHDDAAAQEVELEIGTRGTDRAHLEKYLDIAQALEARVVRTMVQKNPEGTLDRAQVVQNLRSLTPRLDSQGVDLAIETYEQVSTQDLVSIIQEVDHPRVGIALDPANCVAGLEHPRDVIDLCAPYTLNLHVKDFAFSRQQGWVGFTYAGAPMGEGLLDYAYEVQQVQPEKRGISQIVEHWLVWQEDAETTVAEERRWTQQTLDYIRSNQ